MLCDGKECVASGSLVNSDVLNFPPPTFSPDTGLFYVHEQNSLRISYLLEPDPRGSMGLGGIGGGGGVSYGTFLDAIDYKTGKIKWSHPWEGGNNSGLLSTAGNLIFTGAPGSFASCRKRHAGRGADTPACECCRVGIVAARTAPAFGRPFAPRYGSDLLTLRLRSLCSWVTCFQAAQLRRFAGFARPGRSPQQLFLCAPAMSP